MKDEEIADEYERAVLIDTFVRELQDLSKKHEVFIGNNKEIQTPSKKGKIKHYLRSSRLYKATTRIEHGKEMKQDGDKNMCCCNIL